MLILTFSLGCQREDSALISRDATTTEIDTPSLRGTQPDVGSVLESARRSLSQGLYPHAAQQLRTLLLREPENADALFLFAQTKAAQGMLQEAIDTLGAIPATHPELGITALGQAADWLIQINQYDAAKDRLKQILRQNNAIPMAHRRLAQLLNNQGQRIEAAPHLRALARLGDVTEAELYGLGTFSDPFVHVNAHPYSPEIAPNQLTQARVLYYDGRPRSASAMAEQVRIEHPQSATAAAFALRMAADLQDDDWFTRLASGLPDDISNQPEYWYALGTWHLHHEKLDVATRCFLEAVTRDDTDRFSYLGLARSLEKLEHLTESKRALHRFTLLDEAALINEAPKRTPAQLARMSLLLRQLHRPAEAIAWERLAQQTPSPSHDIDPAVPPSWRTCGLAPDEWPLPKLAAIARPANPKAQQPQNDKAAIQLVNVAENVRLDFRYRPRADDDREALVMPETNGGGIAVIDYDLDGWPDLFFNQGGGVAFDPTSCLPKQLFRNLAGNSYFDVSSYAECNSPGYGQGVAVADLNQDGFKDLVVANIGSNDLYINHGDGTFAKSLFAKSASNGNQWTTSIVCGDLSGDGLPEIIEINYIDDQRSLTAECVGTTSTPLCNPQRYQSAKDRFLLNDGKGGFEVWNEINSQVPPGYGFAAIIANFDGKNGNDLFVANDTSGNHYWVSQPSTRSDEKFDVSERAELLGCARGPHGIFQSSMGIAAGDFDRNGWIDLQVTNYTDESSDLFMQQPSGIFANQSYRYRLDEVTRTQLGWGTQAVDFDSDGWLDFAIVNGNLYNHSNDGSPYRMAPQVVRGGPRQYIAVEPQSLGDDYWSTPTLGRCIASIDWNRDGQVDLVSTHLDAKAALLENQSRDGGDDRVQPHWIQLELVGTQGDRDAVGAKVIVRTENETHFAWVTGGGGYLCSNEAIITVGLGRSSKIDRVEIQWDPDHHTRLEAVPVDRRYLVLQNEPNAIRREFP